MDGRDSPLFRRNVCPMGKIVKYVWAGLTGALGRLRYVCMYLRRDWKWGEGGGGVSCTRLRVRVQDEGWGVMSWVEERERVEG